jgi:hypothetical protein
LASLELPTFKSAATCRCVSPMLLEIDFADQFLSVELSAMRTA